ncbi:MAG: LysR family transcriptional regulator, partial [Alphaproteobacteria bacterium]|nr:LysR family transcriptional regulator [Alphaproteobacteria bacterium]
MADWDGWRAVLLMARQGTLASAAAALGVDPTTAARRLRRLEEAVGLRLFERQGTRLRPTAACLGLLPRIETAETELLAAERSFGPGAPGPARTLRLTAVAFMVDHLLAPALPELLAGRRLRVELQADNRNLSLARREADLAVRLGRPDPPQASAQRLGDVPYAVYAAVGRD